MKTRRIYSAGPHMRSDALPDGAQYGVAAAPPGFTLVELLVVVLIIGILSAISIPQYTKSIETARADDASAYVKMVGNTNRMFQLDNSVYADGVLTNSNTAGACPAIAPPAPAGGGDLVKCKYLGGQNWDTKGYTFRAVDGKNSSSPCSLGATGANYVACAKRCTGPSPCTNSGPYLNWGYTMTKDGVVKEWGGAPKPP